MADTEAGAGTAETAKEETMALEEEVVVAEVEVAKESTPTTTMQEEVMVASMEAEAAEGIMDTITTSIEGTYNTHSHIFNNHRCPQQYRYRTLFQVAVHHQHTKATIWTAMQIKWVTMPTVTSGATKGNHIGLDQPHLVQRASSR